MINKTFKKKKCNIPHISDLPQNKNTPNIFNISNENISNENILNEIMPIR